MPLYIYLAVKCWHEYIFRIHTMTADTFIIIIQTILNQRGQHITLALWLELLKQDYRYVYHSPTSIRLILLLTKLFYSIFLLLATEHNMLIFVGSIIIPDSNTNALTKSVPVITNISPTPEK